MMHFTRLSLRWKLILIIMTPVFLVITGLATYLTIHASERHEDEKLRETLSLIQILKPGLLELSLHHSRSTELAIRLNTVIESFESIAYVWTFDRSGGLYHYYRRVGLPEIDPPFADDLANSVTGDLLRVSRPLTEGGSQFASIQVVRSGLANTNLVEQIQIISTVGITLLLLSFLLASSLQRQISSPIANLVDLLQRVSKDKDYSLRWTPQTTTDFNALGQGFNEMLSTTESHIRRASQFACILEDSINEIHIYESSNLELIWLNRGARRHLGLELNSCANLTLLDVMPDIPKEQMHTHLRGLAQNEHDRIRLSTRIRRADKTTYPADVLLQLAQLDAKEVIVAMLLDMSERESAEAAKRRFEERLRQSQKLESLGVLASGIAHDFNNLLTGIVGHANLAMNETREQSKAYSHLTKVETTAMRAGELCNQLLAYSGKGRFVVEPLDFSEIVREMISMLELSISKTARLALELAPSLPKIEVDGTQVRQVVMNLITNASDSIGNGIGLITIRTGMDTLDDTDASAPFFGTSLESGDYVFIEVSDTGSGMAPDTIERIFDPFFSTKDPGRGLGLSAVLGIVRGHGGALEVQSECGLGTSFRALFPVVKHSQDHACPSRELTPNRDAYELPRGTERLHSESEPT